MMPDILVLDLRSRIDSDEDKIGEGDGDQIGEDDGDQISGDDGDQIRKEMPDTSEHREEEGGERSATADGNFILS